MITEKTSLQPKFNQLRGAAPGKILKFNSSQQLIVVDPYSEGLLAQVKVTVPSGQGYGVSCSPQAKSFYSDSSNTKFFFNLPSLNVEYTFSIGKNNQTPQIRKITPTEYRQYQITIDS